MTDEFKKFLMKNKKQVSEAMKKFEEKSRNFDKKISKILSVL